MAIKNIIVAIMNKWWSIEKPVVAINNNGPWKSIDIFQEKNDNDF
jgi:hypothetical protein